MRDCGFELASIFSDGLILQHGVTNVLYGKTGWREVTVFVGERSYKAEVDEMGNFTVEIEPMPCGGPYEIIFEGKETLRIRDVYFGEVFLLSGQSNMELPVSRTLDVSYEEIRHTDLPLVRQFHIPGRFSFDKPLQDLPEGNWCPATQEAIMDFSAVGLFFAKELYTRKKIPVGLIQTAVGGSRIEAWMRPEVLKTFGEDKYDRAQFCNMDFVEFVAKQDREAAAWRAEIARKEEYIAGDCIPEQAQRVMLPAMTKEMGFENFCGSLVFYKEVEIRDFTEEALLYLGAVIDMDEVYINGKFVGETMYRYPPRKYPVPRGVLKKGKNIITARIEIEGGNGGFVEGMPYYLDTGTERIGLEGEWRYLIENEAREAKPASIFPPELAVGLCYSSIMPLRRIRFNSVLWYQGESNVYHAYDYAERFRALTEDFRSLFGRKIPFFCVQLSNFLDPATKIEDSGWGEMRYQQMLCQNLEQVYLVPSMDVGQSCDLHPQNKKAVGQRLFAAYAKEMLKEETHYEMPCPVSADYHGNVIRIRMSYMNLPSRQSVRGIAVAYGENRKTVCQAWAEGDILQIVLQEQIEEAERKPVVVYYDWYDAPEYTDLRNEYDVISGSFRVECSADEMTEQ